MCIRDSFKTYGDGFKYSYKAVTAIFDGDSSTSGWEGIKLGSKLKDLTTGLTSGNSLEGWACLLYTSRQPAGGHLRP